MATDSSARPRQISEDGERPETQTHSSAPPARRAPAGKLRLPRGRPLRAAMLSAFAGVLRGARRAARGSAEDPVRAVHEYRKALRRARAVVALLSPSLGRPAARGLTGHLKAAFRVTNAFRDADILLKTLRGVPPEPDEDLPRHAIEVALELERRRTQAETAETLSRGVRGLAALPAAMEIVLDPALSVHDVERGLARSRRRERRTLARALETGRDEDVHEWRKRVKELRYQLELLASTGSRELRRREKDLGRLAQDLGDVTDLFVLKREIGRREHEGEIPPASGLAERLRRLSTERSRELLSLGSQLFEEDPKTFARQVLAERG